MRSLLDDLRRSATPLQVTSKQGMVKAIKATHLALLRAAIAGEHDDAVETSGGSVSADGENDPSAASDDVLRRYALWLEDAAIDGGDLAGREAESALNLAATLYEFTGRHEATAPRTIFRPPLSDLLRSALLGSLTAYQAHCSLVARRAKERLLAYQPASATERLHDTAGLTVLALLGREFHEAFSRATPLRAFATEAARELKRLDATNREYLEADRAAALGLACGMAATGMLLRAPHLVRQAVGEFERIAAAAVESDDAGRYWLAQRLGAVAGQMHRANADRLLFEARAPLGYRRALGRDAVFEFWGPQLEAIEKGIFRSDVDRHFVVSIPTGAGKTLLAEFAILNALRGDEPRWAVYVTPSRALVNQVSGDLRRRFADTNIAVRTVVAGAEQNGFVDEELAFLSGEKGVVVTTPEKLDAYYRNARELFDNCALVIFDEAHKVADGGRGSLLESLVTRFTVLQSRTRLVLLSGVLSNHEEFVAWLGSDRTESIIARRRPTRQIRGLAVRHDSSPGKPRGTEGATRRVDFSGGLALVHEDDDLADPIEMQLPQLFQGHYTEKRAGPGWREEREKTHSSTIDHARGVAGALSRAPGTTLVFVQDPRWAESSCRRFALPPAREGQQERELLARALATDLGDEHELVAHVRRGVAFHHARLPTGVQRTLELGLERGWIKVMFATSTLREGLNTAVTNVILAGNTQYDEAIEARTAVRESDFENLAGRAGRPFRELEGRVILVPDSLATAQAVAAGKRYLLVGDEALRACSQLGALADALERSGDDLFALPEPDQSLLLSLAAADIDEFGDLAAFFEQSLWAQQEDEGKRTRTAAAICARAFARATEVVGPDRVRLAARTGFSLSSAEQLRDQLSSYAPVLAAQATVSGHDRIGEVLPPLLEVALRLPEVRRGALRSKVEWQAHLEPVRQWVEGQPYPAVLESALRCGALGARADLGDAVKYCADLSTWLSWAFGACYTVLKTLVDPVDLVVGLLPLLVKYGVSTRAAAYLALLGVADRSAAQALAELYAETGRPLSLAGITEWMPEIRDNLEELFPGRDVLHELLRRQAFGRRSRLDPFVWVRAAFFAPMVAGQRLSLSLRDGTGLDLIDRGGRVIGAIEDTATVLTLTQGALEQLVGVVTTPPGRRSNTTLIAVVRQAAV